MWHSFNVRFQLEWQAEDEQDWILDLFFLLVFVDLSTILCFDQQWPDATLEVDRAVIAGLDSVGLVYYNAMAAVVPCRSSKEIHWFAVDGHPSLWWAFEHDNHQYLHGLLFLTSASGRWRESTQGGYDAIPVSAFGTVFLPTWWRQNQEGHRRLWRGLMDAFDFADLLMFFRRIPGSFRFQCFDVPFCCLFIWHYLTTTVALLTGQILVCIGCQNWSSTKIGVWCDCAWVCWNIVGFAICVLVGGSRQSHWHFGQSRSLHWRLARSLGGWTGFAGSWIYQFAVQQPLGGDQVFTCFFYYQRKFSSETSDIRTTSQ